MTVSIETMAGELKQLRPGLGVQAPDLLSRVGPALRQVFDIGPEDDPAAVRRKIISTISIAVQSLPAEVALALRASLALPPAPQDRFLQPRMSWLGREIDRHPRTAARRADLGFTLLAERLLGDATPTEFVSPESAYAPDGWYVERFRAVLQLTRDPVHLYEERSIVATKKDLDAITVTWAAPKRADGAAARDMTVEMLFGGDLVQSAELSTPAVWNGRLQLPKPLAIGDKHTYQVRVSALDRKDYWPHYVLSPHRRFDDVTITVKFDPQNMPVRVWRLAGVPYQVVRDEPPASMLVDPDAASEVSLHVLRPREGLCYGLRWQPEHDESLGG